MFPNDIIRYVHDDDFDGICAVCGSKGAGHFNSPLTLGIIYATVDASVSKMSRARASWFRCFCVFADE